MNIGSVNSGKIHKAQTDLKTEQAENAYAKQAEETKTTERTDTLELSEEARNLSPIQARINEGGYNDPDILKYVAQRMAYEIQSEK